MEEGGDLQSIQRVDFCGVWGDRDGILEKTELPQFSNWWERLMKHIRETERPSLDSMAFSYAVTGEEDLGQKAIRILRDILPGYIPLGGHREYYPELEADLATASSCKALAYVYSFLYPLLVDNLPRHIGKVGNDLYILFSIFDWLVAYTQDGNCLVPTQYRHHQFADQLGMSFWQSLLVQQ